MPFVTDAVNWLEEHAALSTAIVVGSMVFLIASVWAVHRLLTTIPPDYFQHKHKPFERWDDSHPVLRWAILIGKNLLGGLLILAGLVMLLTPGQGILSIVLGIALVDIPGKPALQRRLIHQKRVLGVVNRLRARANQPPLEF